MAIVEFRDTRSAQLRKRRDRAVRQLRNDGQYVKKKRNKERGL